MFESTVTRIDDSGNVYISFRSPLCRRFTLGDALDLFLESRRVLRNVPYLSGAYCSALGTVLIKKEQDVYLSIRYGNAAKEYGLSVGHRIDLEVSKPGSYWEKENAYSFQEISDRREYKDEESFANFRRLFVGRESIFRSSSPVDDMYGRSDSVVSCIRKYKIRTIIDMADSRDEYEKLLSVANEDKREQLLKCDVFPIGNDCGLFSKEYEQAVANAVRVINIAKMPCLIHCRAGKRRSGFICAILQALDGMSADEIMSDYMVSYENNNNVTYANNPRRYLYLRDDTIGKILRHISGGELDNLASATRQYLERIGLREREIIDLERKIRQ